MSAQKRYRLEEKFWLNVNNAAEQQIADIIEWLKNEHQFARAIRDGLRLIWSLRHNNSTDVLLELFPNIREMLEVDCPPVTPPDTEEINRRLANIEAKLDRPMRQMIESSIPDTRESGFPAMSPALKQSGSGIGTLGAGRVMELPTFDDDDGGEDTIVLNKSTGKMNGENAIAAMLKIAF